MRASGPVARIEPQRGGPSSAQAEGLGFTSQQNITEPCRGDINSSLVPQNHRLHPVGMRIESPPREPASGCGVFSTAPAD